MIQQTQDQWLESNYMRRPQMVAWIPKLSDLAKALV